MKKIVINIIKSLAMPTIVYVFFLALNFNRFGNFNCFYTIIFQSIIPTIVGYAISFGFICGVFDFTIGARMIIVGLVGGALSIEFGLWGFILGCIVSSMVIAIFTGALFRIARIPSLVVTMGLTMIYEIVGQKISGQFSFLRISPEYWFFGQAPYSMIILVFTAIVFYIINNKTKFSFHVRAVGNNEVISRNMGIKVQSVKFMTFVVGGVFLAIAALLQISESGSMGSQVNLGSAIMLFKPLIGVMIALTLQPICNLAIGIFIGQFSINTIFIGLIASGLPFSLQDVMLGVFLLVVMLISNNKMR